MAEAKETDLEISDFELLDRLGMDATKFEICSSKVWSEITSNGGTVPDGFTLYRGRHLSIS
jgi:hypothetical protein